mmetsp:Transcript_9591/g.24719  ORF Transcript_9591/g.24719 Transcript_9591/m.24719 type:complete len:230 (-) Transcript_9591:329-1018(-)
MLGEGTDTNLNLCQVSALGASDKLPASGREADDLDLATLLVVQELENLGDLLEGQAHLLKLLLDDLALVGGPHLLYGDLSSAVCVRLHKHLVQPLHRLLLSLALSLLKSAVGDLSSCKRILDDDADDNVHEAECGHEEEDDNEDAHHGLPVDNVPDDVVAPSVQGHDLEEREHRCEDGSEVLLVGPDLAIIGGSDSVDVVLLPDLRRGDYAAHVQDYQDNEADPAQGTD